MKKPFYFDRGTKKTFLHTIKMLLSDIKKLEKERNRFNKNYNRNPTFDNPALFYARAKHIEQMLILGIIGEYLLKAVLLKHNFVINKMGATSFSQEFSDKLEVLNGSGYGPTVAQVKEVEKLSLENFSQTLRDDTLGFEECKQIFNKELSSRSYFPNKSYSITNLETKEFYGNKLDYKDAWSVLQKIRNNYGHVPEAKYEQNGVLPFLYNFLVYVSKKEFAEFFKYLRKFKSV